MTPTPMNDDDENQTRQGMTPERFEGLTPKEKEEYRDALATQSNAELERFFAAILPQITDALKVAAAEQDEAGLKRIAAGCAAYQSQLAEWNDGCGSRASANLLAVVESLGHTRDDIGAALRGELPGQAEAALAVYAGAAFCEVTGL